jgi:hypothetical protein
MTRALIRAFATALLALPGLAEGFEARRDAAWVDGRVAALQPKAEERRIDQIGWARDIRNALALAREHGRLVFLFTMDGRFTIGRC